MQYSIIFENTIELAIFYNTVKASEVFCSSVLAVKNELKITYT